MMPICINLATAALAPEADPDDLARQATDPTASLMAMNFQTTYVGGYHGTGIPGEANDAWSFAFRPVIPFEFLGKPNILRLTLPYQVGGRGDEGFGPISIFDLVVFNGDWGRWGVGPAVGGVWQVNKKLNVGAFTQNVFWSDTALTQIPPVIAYQLGSGWPLSAGDLQFIYA